MDILNPVTLESNSQIKINFDGGDLSSDAGLLLFKEFLFKIGAIKLINRLFKTNDTALYRTIRMMRTCCRLFTRPSAPILRMTARMN